MLLRASASSICFQTCLLLSLRAVRNKDQVLLLFFLLWNPPPHWEPHCGLFKVRGNGQRDKDTENHQLKVPRGGAAPVGTRLGRHLAFRNASQPAKVSVGHGASGVVFRGW